jgi:hypothetical protein
MCRPQTRRRSRLKARAGARTCTGCGGAALRRPRGAALATPTVHSPDGQANCGRAQCRRQPRPCVAPRDVPERPAPGQAAEAGWEKSRSNDSGSLDGDNDALTRTRASGMRSGAATSSAELPAVASRVDHEAHPCGAGASLPAKSERAPDGRSASTNGTMPARGACGSASTGAAGRAEAMTVGSRTRPAICESCGAGVTSPFRRWANCSRPGPVAAAI